jgi:hypothetical protein
LSGVVAALIVLGAACGSDSATLEPIGLSSSGTTAGGTDTTHSPSPSPTSSGPVASITLTPAQLSVGKGNYASLTFNAYDAKGVRIVGKRAAWASSNVNIVTVGDTGGVVFGKELGNATVTATIDGFTATSNVTVVAASPTPTPTPPQPGVASFALRVYVSGFLADSSLNRTDPVAGATVKLTRMGGVTGDTLATPVDGGSATTDATGLVSFANLAGGTSVVDVTPPTGSPYRTGRASFAPPRTSEVQAVINLSRKP